ncbi:hypothetical protein V5799_006177 [Amblyomma americanum]|uniref:Uncharacterized protein n=1 Tax=Amblyomma americanum TaxID=6943 RepID=A0AAQ4DX54_AMBAM
MRVLKTLFATALNHLAALYHGGRRTAATGAAEDHRALRNDTNHSSLSAPLPEDWSLNIDSDLHLPVFAHAPHVSSNDTSEGLVTEMEDVKDVTLAPRSAAGNLETWANVQKPSWRGSLNNSGSLDRQLVKKGADNLTNKVL